jgi:hypothetical protein
MLRTTSVSKHFLRSIGVRNFAVPAFHYQELFATDPAREVKTPYKKLTGDFVKTVNVDGQTMLKVWFSQIVLE